MEDVFENDDVPSTKKKGYLDGKLVENLASFSSHLGDRQVFHLLKNEGRTCKLSRMTGDPRPFPCYTCEKRFKLSHHLDAHLLTHTGVRPYPCEYCNARFTQLSSMRRHCSKIHRVNAVPRISNKFVDDPLTTNNLRAIPAPTSVDQSICKSCGRKFKSAFSLELHDASNCPFTSCSRLFDSENEPNIHADDSLEVTPLESLRREPQRIRNRRKLKRPCRSYHYVKQIGDMPEENNYNGEDKLRTSSYIVDGDHVERNSNLNPGTTELCENTCNQSALDVLPNCVDIKNEFADGYDNKLEASGYTADCDHFQNKDLNSDATVLDENIYNRNILDILSNCANIKAETAHNTDKQGDSEVIRHLLGSQDCIYDASDLATAVIQSYNSAYVVRSKDRFIDRTVSNRRHICCECNKAFRLAHHLTNHMMTHTGARPYTCFFCDRSFSQMSSLQRHMRTSCKSARSRQSIGYGGTISSSQADFSMIVEPFIAETN